MIKFYYTTTNASYFCNLPKNAYEVELKEKQIELQERLLLTKLRLFFWVVDAKTLKRGQRAKQKQVCIV